MKINSLLFIQRVRSHAKESPTGPLRSRSVFIMRLQLFLFPFNPLLARDGYPTGTAERYPTDLV